MEKLQTGILEEREFEYSEKSLLLVPFTIPDLSSFHSQEQKWKTTIQKAPATHNLSKDICMREIQPVVIRGSEF